MRKEITRRMLVTKLQKPHAFTCATAADRFHRTFVECGLRTFARKTSYGAELLCGEGSPHPGAISDLRFETGDKCFEENGTLFVVGTFVTIRYTPFN